MPPIPTSVAVIAGSVVVGAIALPLVIVLLGFSTGGVVAGSLAAVTHASIGNVAAGSTFALMQSVGTTPLVTAFYGALAGGAIAGGGVGAVAIVKHHHAVAAGIHWVGATFKTAINAVNFDALGAGVRWVGVTVQIYCQGLDLLGHQISQSSVALIGSAQDVLGGIVKAMEGLPSSDAAKGLASTIEALNITSTAHHAVKGVTSAIESLDIPPAAHHVIENAVEGAKDAFGVALWKIASIIHN